MENMDLNIIDLESGQYKTLLTKKFYTRKKYTENNNILSAAIPGTIVSVQVEVGQIVEVGEAVLIMDSMKMNNIICSSQKGIVAKIFVKNGDAVGKGSPMIEFE